MLRTYLNAEYIQTGFDKKDKASVLKAIAALAKKNPVLSTLSEDDIFKALKEREEIGSTGFGNEIAIPHCSLEGIDEFVVGMVTAPKGVQFNAIDKKKVKVFFFIITGNTDNLLS